MDNAIAIDPKSPNSAGRFIDSLIRICTVTDDGFSVCALIDEVKWWAERGTHEDLLWRSCGGAGPVMQVRQLTDGRYTWRVSLLISPNVWVDAGGVNATAPEACRAAIACDGPPRVIHRYLNADTVWYTPAPDHWIASINDDEARVAKHGEQFVWTRYWAGGAVALSLTSNTGGHLQGDAKSLEEAMCAAIDAPERFKRACATLIATLTAANAWPGP
jgi:hypothetical protein